MRRPKPDFVQRTISGVTASIERAVFTEELARADGLLQRIDPRAKVGVFIPAIIVVGLSRSLPILLILYGVVVAMGIASNLSFSFFVKRVLLGIPLFAGIVFLPALFLIQGNPVLSLNFGFGHLVISDNALISGALFITRVAASVSLAVLLVVTTTWADLLKAMRALKAPSIFVVVLGMTYRYIFLFLQTVEHLFLARSSRTVSAGIDAEKRRWVGATMGTLMSKSFKTSNDVYLAMVARGFTGEFRTMNDFKMRDEDWLFVFTSIVVLGAGLMLDMTLR
jgi:cobalt/nickel transport system permease protein